MRIDRLKWLLVLLGAWHHGDANAAGGCTGLSSQMGSDGARIAQIACRENVLWHSPFIDVDGRLASMTVAEAETSKLSDGVTPAWKRVADYWRGSGLLWQMRGFAGASECGYASNDSYASPSCRAFLIDKPWSAAFVSYVLVNAGLPGFVPSASHIDYVRAAYGNPGGSPYFFADPDSLPAATGDLLCFVRSHSTQLGHAGLRSFLAANSTALNMHCDIVVDADRATGRLYMVGGNVLQGVTLRTIGINRQGLPWNLPRGAGRATACWPANPQGCSFNRQDWAALLKLKSPAEIAHLPRPAMPMPSLPTLSPGPARCCIQCVVGSGVPRCPSP